MEFGRIVAPTTDALESAERLVRIRLAKGYPMRCTMSKTVNLLAALTLVCPFWLGKSSSGPADKVEEDWQLVISSPNPDEVGPQITTCMSPVADGSTPFVAFDLNYRDSPTFQSGGLQVKVCSDGDVMSSSSQGTALCQTANETITWTQRMTISNDGTVAYTVANGKSTTWGAFGDTQGLDPVSFTAEVTSLESYSPDTSVAKSGAGWQSNRVAKMSLVCVRYYSGNQLISTDTNSRTVELAT